MPRPAHLERVQDRVRATLRAGNGKGVATPHIRTRQGKLRLLTRQALDGRTAVAKQFDSIAASIATDMGGEACLSTIQKHLVEAFAGCAVNVSDLNARLLLGEKVDLAQHAQAVTTLVRVASRLPIGRVAKDITSLASIIRADQQAERDRLARERAAKQAGDADA